ncbi:hypothetical protein HZH68_016137 [Vespula germanica]|uniref:Uncharacterized protein n=1 Tax=Vespula germanica TaxID=30212 RepID=A0A834J4B8_VESGE|nr:hypothetical protein HZH68_016137 [Vespula germanica]
MPLSSVLDYCEDLFRTKSLHHILQSLSLEYMLKSSTIQDQFASPFASPRKCNEEDVISIILRYTNCFSNSEIMCFTSSSFCLSLIAISSTSTLLIRLIPLRVHLSILSTGLDWF